jgi:hypothetical protein
VNLNFNSIDEIMKHERKERVIEPTIVMNSNSYVIALPGDCLHETEKIENSYNRIEVFKNNYNLKSNL